MREVIDAAAATWGFTRDEFTGYTSSTVAAHGSEVESAIKVMVERNCTRGETLEPDTVQRLRGQVCQADAQDVFVDNSKDTADMLANTGLHLQFEISRIHT